MSKLTTLTLSLLAALMFLVPSSEVLAKRKTCQARITVRNYMKVSARVHKIKTQRKGGTVFYRSTFWKKTPLTISAGGSYVFYGSFKIKKKKSCTSRRLWVIHYNSGKSPFVETSHFKWISGKNSGGYAWTVILNTKKNK